MSHCATCNCRDDEKPAPPAVSSEWARRAAKEATEAAVRAAREKRKKPVGGSGSNPPEGTP